MADGQWRGDRGFLTFASAADEADFLAAATASIELHAPWVTAPTTPDAYSEHVAHFSADDQFGYVVRRNDNGALVGAIDIGNAVWRALCSAYLGYFVFEGHQRQGLMAEAVAGAVELAFTQLGLHRLEANIQPDNHASRALIENVGFRLEGYSPRYLKIGGEWQDHERWALTIEEWADS